MIRVSGLGFLPSRLGGVGFVAGTGVLDWVRGLMSEQCHADGQLATIELRNRRSK
jgi:hypothetical protein